MATVLILKIRYRAPHYLGMALALVGTAIVVTISFFYPEPPPDDSAPDQFEPKAWLGCLLVGLAGLLFVSSNLWNERVLAEAAHNKPNNAWLEFEFNGWLGLFGTLIVTAQAFAMQEQKDLKRVPWEKPEVIVLLSIYTISLLAWYHCAAKALRRFGTMFFELSLTAAPAYNMIVGYILYASGATTIQDPVPWYLQVIPWVEEKFGEQMFRVHHEMRFFKKN